MDNVPPIFRTWTTEIEGELNQAKAELAAAETENAAAGEALAQARAQRTAVTAALAKAPPEPGQRLAPAISNRLLEFDEPVRTAEGRRVKAKHRVAEAKRLISASLEALSQLEAVANPASLEDEARRVLTFERASA